NDAVALCTAGYAVAFVVGDFNDGGALIDRALVLNPNLAWAWLFSGWVKAWLGQPEVAIEHEARAMRLSPPDPHMFNLQGGIALAHFLAGRYAEALSWAEMAARQQPNYVIANFTAAASGALLGRAAEARKTMAHLRQLDPTLCISNLEDRFPVGRSEHFATWVDGLRKAGMPE